MRRTCIPLPSRDLLEELFDYNPESGLFRRKIGGRKENLKLMDIGYLRVSIQDVNYLAHRLIYKMMTGEEPAEIDHIDGNRSNNKWANLRAVDRKTNSRNRRLGKNNTSGVIGVSRQGSLWHAYIVLDGKQHHLGFFKTIEEAKAARKAAERGHGFGPSHGAV